MTLRAFPLIVLVALAVPSASAMHLSDGLEFDLGLTSVRVELENEASTSPASDDDPALRAGPVSVTFNQKQNEQETAEPQEPAAPPEPVQEAAAPTLCAPRPSTGLGMLEVLPQLCIPLIVDPAPLLPVLPESLMPTAAPTAAPAPAAPLSIESAAVSPEQSSAAALAPLAGVVAVAAASSVAPAAGALWDRFRRFGWLAALYSRMTREGLLAHEARDAIYETLKERPGVAISDLAKDAGIPRNTATHHLHMMEKQGLVNSVRKGRVRLYFPAGSATERRNSDVLAVLRHDTTSALARAIGQTPGVDQAGLCEAFGLQPSLAHWHMGRLVENGLVMQVRDGRRVRYYPGDAFHLVR